MIKNASTSTTLSMSHYVTNKYPIIDAIPSAVAGLMALIAASKGELNKYGTKWRKFSHLECFPSIPSCFSSISARAPLSLLATQSSTVFRILPPWKVVGLNWYATRNIRSCLVKSGKRVSFLAFAIPWLEGFKYFQTLPIFYSFVIQKTQKNRPSQRNLIWWPKHLNC